ncbi:hypothetical protein BDN70DRAFT_878083 [Pholiota conissans]|uniref:Uncharacterized protein n=1 Tax=Pholiota conissans TaxID=109636 RepID=A0A9P5Z4Z3_9AGAR|nr:hypothetical protein BDN70DRAFT_878083 [Pholiota conissans]
MHPHPPLALTQNHSTQPSPPPLLDGRTPNDAADTRPLTPQCTRTLHDPRCRRYTPADATAHPHPPPTLMQNHSTQPSSSPLLDGWTPNDAADTRPLTPLRTRTLHNPRCR